MFSSRHSKDLYDAVSRCVSRRRLEVRYHDFEALTIGTIASVAFVGVVVSFQFQ
jgi:hypothetical protein